MDKQQYLDELRVRLKGIPQEEIEDAISYCEEYFDDAGEGAEQQVVEELGSPFKFAAQIKADCESKRQQTSNPKQESQMTSSVKTIILLILGICALPIALPLTIAIIACLFAIIVILVSVLFAGIVSAISMLGFGLPLFFKGFKLGTTIYDTCMMLGGGLFTIGLAGLCIFVVIWFVKTILPMLVRGLTKIYDKMKEKTKHEK